MSIEVAIPAERNVIKEEVKKSQQPIQFATQHVISTVQKSHCMSFHWSGGTNHMPFLKVCHLRCVCENWKSYVVKQNYVNYDIITLQTLN